MNMIIELLIGSFFKTSLAPETFLSLGGLGGTARLPAQHSTALRRSRSREPAITGRNNNQMKVRARKTLLSSFSSSSSPSSERENGGGAARNFAFCFPPCASNTLASPLHISFFPHLVLLACSSVPFFLPLPLKKMGVRKDEREKIRNFPSPKSALIFSSSFFLFFCLGLLLARSLFLARTSVPLSEGPAVMFIFAPRGGEVIFFSPIRHAVSQYLSSSDADRISKGAPF